MNVPTPLECVNADAQPAGGSVNRDAPPASGDADDRRHRRRVELITALVSLIVAAAGLITALKS